MTGADGHGDRHDRPGRHGGRRSRRRPTRRRRPAPSTVDARTRPARSRSRAVATSFGTTVITVAATHRAAPPATRSATVDRRFVTGHHGARRHRPGRRRQRAGHVRVPDVRQLQAGGVRPAAVPGHRGRRQTSTCGPGARPHADVRQRPRRAAARRLRAQPGAAPPRPPRRSPAQLHDRRRLGLEPADRGAGLRRPACSWTPAGRPLGTVQVAGQPGVPASSRSSCRRRRWGRRQRAGSSRSCCTARTGSPPTRPAASRRPRRTSSSACARRAGRSPICAVDPGTVPKAMDVLTPAGVSPGRRARPDRAPGRDHRGAGALVPDQDAEAHLVGGAVAPDHVARRHARAGRCGRRLASWVQVTRSTSPGLTATGCGQRHAALVVEVERRSRPAASARAGGPG